VSPVALASADPAAWKVKADEPPAPTGFRSAFPVPVGQVESLAFAPAARQAAVVNRPGQSGPFEWVRYDLRRTEPLGRIPLGDAKTPADQALLPNNAHYSGGVLSALSPSGDRFAVRDVFFRFIGVWSKDGRRVGMLRLPGGRDRAGWTGFGGEDRLWVLAGNQLALREVATDKVLVKVPGEVAGRPALTPGGKWLAASVGRELLFLDAADGSRGGSIPLPDGWGGSKGPTWVAVHPSGRAVAVTLANERSDLLLGVWDLATGRLTDSLIQTYHLSQQKLTTGLQWVGQGRLLCGNALVDLDLHSILCNHYPPPNYLGPMGQMSPDGRIWFVRPFTNEEWAKVEKKLPPLAGPSTRTFLTAGTLPEAVIGPLEAAGRGFLWHPGVTVRLVFADSLPRKHRAKIAEATAEGLAKEGYRVAPDASITVEAIVKLGGKTSGTGKRIPREQLTEQMKRELRFQPMKAWYELTDVYEISTQARVLDAEGRPALQTPTFGSPISVKKGSGEDAAWQHFIEHGVGLNLPRLFLRDSGHKRLLLPKSFRPGVDGLLEPPLDGPQGTIKDGFALPEDG
jgi:hypothetical protein